MTYENKNIVNFGFGKIEEHALFFLISQVAMYNCCLMKI